MRGFITATSAAVALLTAVAVPAPASAGSLAGANTPQWTDCGGGFECATAEVPLDYADPDGEQVRLALIRKPAGDPARRIGSLLFNPGGPGNSGVDATRLTLNRFSPAVRARFDIVGFDSRGVGASTPVRCFDSGARQQEFFARLPRVPIGEREERLAADLAAEFGRRCDERDGRLLAHVSTADVARDLDRIRALVGDPRLSYVGYSYGTFLGAVYANLYPDRVRAMVLDGVVDPVAYSTSGVWLSQLLAGAGEHAVDGFAAACEAAGERCRFSAGGSAPQIRQRVDRLMASLRGATLPAPGADPPGEVTFSFAVNTTLVSMYNPALFGPLAAALRDAELGDGSALLTLARSLGVPGALPPNPNAPYNNGADEAFSAILCSDSAFPRASLWPAMATAADAVNPIFGRRWLYRTLPCATWPARSVPQRYTGPWSAWTAAPVLMIGTRWDAATSLDSARRLAALMPNSRLLTFEGHGHTTLFHPSGCVTSTVDRYLVDGVPPARGAVCRADAPPFGSG